MVPAFAPSYRENRTAELWTAWKAARVWADHAADRTIIVDFARLTGSVIDAYTLAPNDEDAKREAVRAAIERGLR